MFERRLAWAGILIASACALTSTDRAEATGVGISGFLPMVGIGLTNEFNDDFNTFSVASLQPSGIMLGQGGTAFYDIAIVDTGAAVSVLTAQADANFNIDGPYAGEPDGFRGTETIPIGGATGALTADINDPLGLYAGGLLGATTGPLTLNTGSLRGQTNTSIITLPTESDLPNVVGLPFSSQYATSIRSDLPQIFSLNGRTVRAPQIEFLQLGSGGHGITRRAPLTLNPGASFTSPPSWFYNIANFDLDKPQENPSQPTVLQGGLFLTVNVQNEGHAFGNSQFLLDTGADVTAVSELTAVQLGFDPVLDKPDFTVAVIGSGGTKEEVPGFFADQFTILTVGGSLTLTHVPIIVLDVPDPGNPGNIVPGIVGTNLLAGRNLVIDPNPATGGGGASPSLYIGDPVTTQLNWSAVAASGTWATGGNWSGGVAPTILGIANVRHVSGGNQTAVVAASATLWELNVSGAGGQKMTVEVSSGMTLTTFSGTNIESDGVVQLDNATLDAQFVEITGGVLRGSGTVMTGSGPVPGQVENRGGTVAPGNGIGALTIVGRFANSSDGRVAIDLGGTTPGTQHDQLVVTGSAALAGVLQVSLASFTPGVGNSFTILTASDGLSGTFDTLSAPLGYNWYINYGTNSAQLVVGVPGDYNHNGVVDAADYSVWRDTEGSTTNLAADGNGNGAIDAGDYAFWKSHFGLTMGAGAGSNGSVPEPATMPMLMVAAAALLGYHRQFCRRD